MKVHSGFDVMAVRGRFPALALCDDGRRRIYFDNPAGTQVPETVIEAMGAAMTHANANLGGEFVTSRQAGALVERAHERAAMFVNAASPREVVFAQNMTTATFHLSRCLARRFSPGQEIVVSRMDHDANVAPWLLMAEDVGMKVRWLDFDPESCEFAADALARVVSEKTALVAVGYASNLTGTINDVAAMAALAREAGAVSFIDAVQYAPHGAVDVKAIGCDFLVCSAYKFFGPHQAILWGREEVLAETFAYQVRPALDGLPDRFETGTAPREGLAGVSAAIDYLAGLGGGGDRAALETGFRLVSGHEQALTGRLIDGLLKIPELKVHGVTSANGLARRVPTVSVSIAGRNPRNLARALGDEGIFVWSGHNYAIEPVRRLGLEDKGGVLRIGPAHYNTVDEVDETVAALRRIVNG